MGFFGSLWNAAVSVVKSVGRVVVEGAKRLLGMSETTQRGIENVTEKIVERERIIERYIPAEILGYKAMRAGRNIDEFNSTSDFIQTIDAEIEAKDEEIKKLSLEERKQARAIGTSLYLKTIEEKKNISIPIEFWKEAVERGLSAKEIDKLLEEFKNKGIDVKDFVKYLRGELNIIESDDMDEFLKNAFREIEDLDKNELNQKIEKLKHGNKS